MNDEDFARDLFARVVPTVSVQADADRAIREAQGRARLGGLVKMLGVTALVVALVVAGTWLLRPRPVQAVPDPVQTVSPNPMASPDASAGDGAVRVADKLTPLPAWPDCADVRANGHAVWCESEAGLVVSTDAGRTVSLLAWSDALTVPGMQGWLERSWVSESGAVYLAVSTALLHEIRRFDPTGGWRAPLRLPQGSLWALEVTPDGGVAVALSEGTDRLRILTSNGDLMGDLGFIPGQTGEGAPVALWFDGARLAVGLGDALWQPRMTDAWVASTLPLKADERPVRWGPAVVDGPTLQVAVTVCPPGVTTEDEQFASDCTTRVLINVDQGPSFVTSDAIPATSQIVADGPSDWRAATDTTLYRLRGSWTWASEPLPARAAKRPAPIAPQRDVRVWDECSVAPTCATDRALWATSDGGQTWTRTGDLPG